MSAKSHKGNHRKRKLGRRASPPGAAPGTIHSDPLASPTTIRVIAFGATGIIETQLDSPAQLADFVGKWPNLWIDVTGLGNADMIRGIGELLGLHPLALEDVVNVHQRAKVDAFRDWLFVVARMIEKTDTLVTEQISFFVKKGMLVTFQERPGDCWDPVRQRLHQSRGRIREFGADYLMYALLDSIVDSYFPAMDMIGEQVDTIEEAITIDAESTQMHQIHAVRGQLLMVRRAIRPHREMINELVRDGHEIISEDTRVFLRDCYDHVIQVMDLVDTYRELTADLRDFYLSSVSNRMNEIMKVLTIISTIFIPLSFVAGVYGMNFDTKFPWNMPELEWEYGYLFSWSIMIMIASGLLVYFRRRRWI
ncbi:MAG: magnesium/cobalt transporter CorA [Pirellulales bacterium]